MSSPSPLPIKKRVHYPWPLAWFVGLTQPLPFRYRKLLQDEDTSTGRVFRWMFWSVFLGTLLPLLAQAILTGVEGMPLLAFLITPLVGVLGMLLLFLEGRILAFVLNLFRSDYVYEEVVFLLSASQSPLFLIVLFVRVIPNVRLLLLPLLGVYGVLLLVMVAISAYRPRPTMESVFGPKATASPPAGEDGPG